MRIISLVPSITELLYDLQLEDEVVGITKFCVHPDHWYRMKTRVGGTKTIHIDKVLDLEPDLIIANKEENTKDQIEALSKKFNVLVTEVKTLEDNIDLIINLGKATNKEPEALELADRFKLAIIDTNREKDESAAYLIWQNPLMTIGSDTYIHSVMEHIGFKNVFGKHQRYPQTDWDEIQQLNPDRIFLSSEPFPFKQKHVEAFSGKLPQSKISLVDGEAFSWYGTRFLKNLDYLKAF